MLAHRKNHRILHGLEKLLETKSLHRSQLQIKARPNREGNVLKLHLLHTVATCDAKFNLYGESKWQQQQR
jgi:hypothetical protein